MDVSPELTHAQYVEFFDAYAAFLSELAKNKFAEFEFERLYRPIYKIALTSYAYPFLMDILKFIRTMPNRAALLDDAILKTIGETFMYFGRRHEINVISMIKFTARA